MEKLKEVEAEIHKTGQTLQETRSPYNTHKAALKRLSELQELRRTLE
jgi:hypothetical protein